MTTIILIGCSKTKAKNTGKHLRHFYPEELYTSDLFQKRKEYAELRGCEWGVLSAKYGLWWQGSKLPWYDLAMKDLPAIEVSAWHAGVALRLVSSFDDDNTDLSKINIEIHAGKDYREPLQEILSLLGFSIVESVIPCVSIGKQLQAYKQAIERMKHEKTMATNPREAQTS